MTTETTSWSERVRELRRIHGSRQKLAALLGCSLETIAAWEKGWWQPREAMQKRLKRLELEGK